MRNIFICIFLLFVSAKSNAQGWTIQAMPPTTTVNSKGSFKADSFIIVGVRPLTIPSWYPVATHTFNGAIQINPVDSQLYWYYFGWRTASGGGGGGSGTVTSIATNNGTGITGGTITTSGTLAIDTGIVSTRAWRQKGIDSLNVLIAARVRYSDTSAMLTPYLRKVDTSSLSDRINLKLNISDTTSMLLPYLQKVDTTAMLNPYLRKVDTAALSTRIDARVKYADTATMLTPYLRKIDTTAVLSPYPNIFTNGLTKSSKTVSLGGALTGATTITTAGANTLAIAGLASGTTNDSFVVADATSGELKRISSARISGGGGITGSGTTNTVAKFTGSTAIGNSLITDDGTTVGVNTTSSNAILQVGTMTVSGVVNPSIIHQGGAFGPSVGGVRNEYKHIIFQNPSSLDVVAGFGFDGLGNLWDGFPFSRTWYGGLSNPKVLAATLTDVGVFSANALTWAGSAPTVLSGTGAGTTPTISVSGTSGSYQVSLTAGTTPAASATVFTVTMASSFASSASMHPSFSPANAAAAALSGTSNVFMDGTTTTHVMTSGSVGLIGGTTYIWNVNCNPKK